MITVTMIVKIVLGIVIKHYQSGLKVALFNSVISGITEIFGGSADCITFFGNLLSMTLLISFAIDTAGLVCCRHKVCGSLHSKLDIGQSIKLVIEPSSVRSISDFYAQVWYYRHSVSTNCIYLHGREVLYYKHRGRPCLVWRGASRGAG